MVYSEKTESTVCQYAVTGKIFFHIQLIGIVVLAVIRSILRLGGTRSLGESKI